MLGIPVNAGAKDLAANKGRMKLLDIGKEVVFPLDLQSIFPPVNRTKESVENAERDINLPQDKVKNALFWFALPTDNVGKVAYNHLLQGNTEKSLELFGKSTAWESKLCLASLHLQAGHYKEALTAISELIEQHCADLCTAIAGQTYQSDSDTLRQQYLAVLTAEVDAYALYESTATSAIPASMSDALKHMAIEAPMSSVEKAITAAKSVNSNDAKAQLAAGKKLMADTRNPLTQLKKMAGSGDVRVNRLCDKLAGQIFQCSVNYHNAIDNSSDEPVSRMVIDDCLELARYAQSIAIGKMTHARIQNGINTLEQKKANLPPAEVEPEVNAIMKALKTFIELPDKIEHSVTLLNTTRPHLQSMKARIGQSNNYYLKISTQVVSNALHNLIEEVNRAQKHVSYSNNTSVKAFLLLLSLKPVVDEAWSTTKIMDNFDMEDDFKRNRYLPNRNSLKGIYDSLQDASVRTGIGSASNSYGSTSSSSSGDTNWGCIIWGIIGFIIFIIIMANQ